MTMTVYPTMNAVGSSTGGRYNTESNLTKFLDQAGGDGYFISGCTMPSASTAGDHTIKITSGEALVSGYIVRMTTEQVISISTGTTGPNYLYLKLTRDGSNNVSASSWKQTTSTTWPEDSLYMGNVIVASTAVSGTSFSNRGWRTPVLGTSWVNYGTTVWDVAGYRKVSSNKACIKGMVKRASTAGMGNIFTLPNGFRPSYYRRFAVNASSYTLGIFSVSPGGSVIWNSGSPVTNFSLECEFDISTV